MIAVQMGVDQGLQGLMSQHVSDPGNGLSGVSVVTAVNQCVVVFADEQHAIARQPAAFKDVDTQGGQIMRLHKRERNKMEVQLSQGAMFFVALGETNRRKNHEQRNANRVNP